MPVKKETKKTAPKKTNAVPVHAENYEAPVFDLMNEEHQAALADVGEFSKIAVGDHVYAFAHAMFVPIARHWMTVGGERKQVLCAVHLTDKLAKLKDAWEPELCPICARVQELYKERKKFKPKTEPYIRIGDFANDVRGKVEFLSYAAPGKLIHIPGKKGLTQKSGEFDKTPKFGFLSQTSAGFQMFKAAIVASGMTKQDFIGRVVRFNKGKKDNGRYDEILDVEILNQTVKVPKILPAMNQFTVYDEAERDKVEDLAKLLDTIIPAVLSGKYDLEKEKKKKPTGAAPKKSR